MKEEKTLKLLAIQEGMRVLQEKERLYSEKLIELRETLEAVKNIGNAGDEVFIPLGSGNFVRGSLKDTEKILVGLGAGVAALRTREDAEKILEKRINELEKALEELSSQMERLASEFEKTQKEE
ncbi:MAG: prefoldin subunit alpha [Candidatus Micrarchaeota archaeon]|nr:prefoldin subunit alpha [Candidatus Micrarchaeota archaeon]